MTTASVHRRSLASYVVWGTAAALFCLPAIAMQFTQDVVWTWFDFLVWGTMLAAAASGYEFLARRGNAFAWRAGAAVAMITCFFLIWVNLAVGIIGSENNPANWMYAAVLATAVGGSIIAHFRSAGMVRAMLATAAVQVLVGAIALIFQLGLDGRAWPRDVIGVTVLITAMWLFAAALFSRAPASA